MRENASSVMICAVLSSNPDVCGVAFEFEIVLFTQDGTASKRLHREDKG